jgi:hypothetical protein
MKLFKAVFEEADVNQSKKNSEIEVAVFAKMTDPEGLKQASEIIEQEQIESQFFNGTRCRVRKETKNSETTYTFTYKLKQEGDELLQSNQEFSVLVDKDFFEGFRHMGKKRLKKTRYVFPSKSVELTMVKEDGVKTVVTLPELKYEVDVYTKEDGTTSEWCKIDIELDAVLPIIGKETEGKSTRVIIKVAHLPFKPVGAMLSRTTNVEHKAVIGKIWDTEWNLTPFDQKVKEEVTTEPPTDELSAV